MAGTTTRTKTAAMSRTRRDAQLRRIAIATALLLAAAAAVTTISQAVRAQTTDASAPISGLAIGAPTQSVPVLDVTGAYKGQRICYVCEFQDDPNILAFFTDTSDLTEALIVELNALYLANRDRNFKAVAAIVAGPEASGWLESLSESAGLEIPLVVFRRGPSDVAARLFELNPDVQNTFLVTENRFVVANVAGITPEQFGLVADATASMLAN
jgi:hypothetical protein